MVTIGSEKNLGRISNLVYGIFSIQRLMTFIKNYNAPKEGNCIFATWHAHQFALHGIEDKAHTDVLISRSVDGEIIARVVNKWGFKTIRGSRAREGCVTCTMQLIEELKSGDSAAIMVDGPAGPAKVVKKGVVMIAKHAGVPIVPVYWYSPMINLVSLPSWDKLRMPLGPVFIVNVHGKPIYVNADNTPEQDEQVRLEVQREFEAIEKIAPQAWKEVFLKR